jgi:hypothetical protein
MLAVSMFTASIFHMENKMKTKKKQAPKERNPFIQHLIQRNGGGVHQKSKKAIRRQDKVQLKKDCLDKAIVLVA